MVILKTCQLILKKMKIEERTVKTGLAEQIVDQRQPLRGEAM